MREAHKFTAPTSHSALATSPTLECQRGRDIKHAWLSSSSLVGESSLCNITHSSERCSLAGAAAERRGKVEAARIYEDQR